MGHNGKFSFEFLESKFWPDGNQDMPIAVIINDVMIRKQAYVHKSVMEELKGRLMTLDIPKEDMLGPPPNQVQ